jgi:hypothetical protein
MPAIPDSVFAAIYQVTPERPAADTPPAVANFLNTFNDGMLVVDIAGRFTCTEWEAVVGLFEAYGMPVAAEDMRRLHGEQDEPGDLHYEGDEDEEDLELLDALNNHGQGE